MRVSVWSKVGFVASFVLIFVFFWINVWVGVAYLLIVGVASYILHKWVKEFEGGDFDEI